jgi:hypothetical protein
VGKVVEFNGITRLDIDPQKVLGRALTAELDGVVILAYDKDGEEYFASSYADGGLVLWLMERCKQKLLKVGE